MAFMPAGGALGSALGLASGPVGWGASALFGLAGLLGIGKGPKHVPVPAWVPSAASADVDAARILKEQPGVLQEWQEESSRDMKSKRHLQELGIDSADEFARWWADTNGYNDLYKAAATTPPAAVDPGTPQDPTGDNYLQGLIKSLMGGFESQANKTQADIAAREAARNSIYSSLGDSNSKIGSGFLNSTIQEILSGEYGKAQEQLNRGKARGQFNDVGFQAGLGSLEKNKKIVASKLQTTADDVLNSYRTKYDDLIGQALTSASSIGSGVNFNLDTYKSQADNILKSATDMAPGALMAAIGNTSLFDMGAIRGDAGTAQGALNLKDVDLLEALSKRKRADEVGRGLGSQGAF